jgi:cytochrome P450
MVQPRSELGLGHRRPFPDGDRRAIDLTTPEAGADPHALFDALRADAPIHWSDAHRGWLVVSHAAVGEGFRAPWLSSDRVPVFERVAAKQPPGFERVVDLLRGWMVFRDPPAHERLRDPVKRVFTPSRLQRLVPMIERTTDDLLDDLAGAGTANLQLLFTRPLPALVIADLLDVPRADRADFQTWSDQLSNVVFAAEMGGDAANVIAAAERFTDYFDGLIEERRRHPGDDVISALLDTPEPTCPRTVSSLAPARCCSSPGTRRPRGCSPTPRVCSSTTTMRAGNSPATRACGPPPSRSSCGAADPRR